MKHPIPSAALESHVAILGKTGSGKSNAAKVIAEDLMDRGERVCVIDPTGTWWGLRLDAKGKKASPYPVVIFGGQRGDIPIEAGNGAAIAEIVGTSSTPAIIDTRLMSVGKRTEFFTGFAETILQRNQGPLNLIIDEAHVFMPQGKVADPKSGAMLHAGNNLVSLGRGIGLRIILISQRGSKLHKDSLTQVETLVAMRVIHPLDRGAVEDWIGEWAGKGQGAEIVSSLPSLPTGEAWIWSPGLDMLARERFPLARTFDSGKPRANVDTRQLAPIDIKAVTARLEDVAKEVVANDPKTLKAEIARLRAELRKQPATDPNAVAEAERQGYERGYADGRLAGVRHVRPQTEILRKGLEGLLGAIVEVEIGALHDAPPAEPTSARRAPQPKPRAPLPSGDAPGITGPQAQFLRALKWWRAMGHEAPTREQVAAIAGWRVMSGHLKNVAGSLRSAGLIDYPQSGRFALTDEGFARAPEPDMGASIVDDIRSTLSGPQQLAFDRLLEIGGGPVSRDDLATACGWNATSGHVKNVLGSLRTLQIIDYPMQGYVALQSWVQP